MHMSKHDIADRLVDIADGLVDIAENIAESLHMRPNGRTLLIAPLRKR